MKNSFGNSLAVTLFGESHGPAIGAVLDGLTPGITVNEELIAKRLSMRRPQVGIGTARREEDRFSILSGVYNGKTTGTPLTVVIPNENVSSGDYTKLSQIARPGHSDYAAYCKYHGFEDRRGGGHFSGRLTAALVAAGAIVEPALQKKGVKIGTHILSLGSVCDRRFKSVEDDLAALEDQAFPVLDPVEEKMKDEVLSAARAGDSVGGVTESAVCGLPAGLGEPFFDSIESMLSHALFAIPGVKGVQFGEGFDLVNGKGSAFNDPFRVKDGKIVTATNHNGGINGGVTNGMPVLFRCAVKPTPSIAKEQETVDFVKKENTLLSVGGRHDPSILPRVPAVVNAAAALVIFDLLLGRYGTDYFGE